MSIITQNGGDNVRSSMSHQAKKGLLIQIIPRYREAGRKEKTIILDNY